MTGQRPVRVRRVYDEPEPGDGVAGLLRRHR